MVTSEKINCVESFDEIPLLNYCFVMTRWGTFAKLFVTKPQVTCLIACANREGGKGQDDVTLRGVRG